MSKNKGNDYRNDPRRPSTSIEESTDPNKKLNPKATDSPAKEYEPEHNPPPEKDQTYPPIVTIDGRVDTDIDHLMDDLNEEEANTHYVDRHPRVPKPHVFSVIEGSIDDDVDSLANHDGTMEHTLVDAPKSFSPADLKDVHSHNVNTRGSRHYSGSPKKKAQIDMSHNKIHLDEEEMSQPDTPLRDGKVVETTKWPKTNPFSSGDNAKEGKDRPKGDIEGNDIHVERSRTEDTPDCSRRGSDVEADAVRSETELETSLESSTLGHRRRRRKSVLGSLKEDSSVCQDDTPTITRTPEQFNSDEKNLPCAAEYKSEFLRVEFSSHTPPRAESTAGSPGSVRGSRKGKHHRSCEDDKKSSRNFDSKLPGASESDSSCCKSTEHNKSHSLSLGKNHGRSARKGKEMRKVPENVHENEDDEQSTLKEDISQSSPVQHVDNKQKIVEKQKRKKGEDESCREKGVKEPVEQNSTMSMLSVDLQKNKALLSESAKTGRCMQEILEKKIQSIDSNVSLNLASQNKSRNTIIKGQTDKRVRGSLKTAMKVAKESMDAALKFAEALNEVYDVVNTPKVDREGAILVDHEQTFSDGEVSVSRNRAVSDQSQKQPPTRVKNSDKAYHSDSDTKSKINDEEEPKPRERKKKTNMKVPSQETEDSKDQPEEPNNEEHSEEEITVYETEAKHQTPEMKKKKLDDEGSAVDAPKKPSRILTDRDQLEQNRYKDYDSRRNFKDDVANDDSKSNYLRRKYKYCDYEYYTRRHENAKDGYHSSRKPTREYHVQRDSGLPSGKCYYSRKESKEPASESCRESCRVPCEEVLKRRHYQYHRGKSTPAEHHHPSREDEFSDRVGHKNIRKPGGYSREHGHTFYRNADDTQERKHSSRPRSYTYDPDRREPIHPDEDEEDEEDDEKSDRHQSKSYSKRRRTPSPKERWDKGLKFNKDLLPDGIREYTVQSYRRTRRYSPNTENELSARKKAEMRRRLETRSQQTELEEVKTRSEAQAENLLETQNESIAVPVPKQPEVDLKLPTGNWQLPVDSVMKSPARYFEKITGTFSGENATRKESPDFKQDPIRTRLVGSPVDPFTRDSDYDSIEFNDNACSEIWLMKKYLSNNDEAQGFARYEVCSTMSGDCSCPMCHEDPRDPRDREMYKRDREVYIKPEPSSPRKSVVSSRLAQGRTPAKAAYATTKIKVSVESVDDSSDDCSSKDTLSCFDDNSFSFNSNNSCYIPENLCITMYNKSPAGDDNCNNNNAIKENANWNNSCQVHENLFLTMYSASPTGDNNCNNTNAVKENANWTEIKMFFSNVNNCSVYDFKHHGKNVESTSRINENSKSRKPSGVDCGSDVDQGRESFGTRGFLPSISSKSELCIRRSLKDWNNANVMESPEDETKAAEENPEDKTKAAEDRQEDKTDAAEDRSDDADVEEKPSSHANGGLAKKGEESGMVKSDFGLRKELWNTYFEKDNEGSESQSDEEFVFQPPPYLHRVRERLTAKLRRRPEPEPFMQTHRCRENLEAMRPPVRQSTRVTRKSKWELEQEKERFEENRRLCDVIARTRRQKARTDTGLYSRGPEQRNQSFLSLRHKIEEQVKINAENRYLFERLAADVKSRYSREELLNEYRIKEMKEAKRRAERDATRRRSESRDLVLTGDRKKTQDVPLRILRANYMVRKQAKALDAFCRCRGNKECESQFARNKPNRNGGTS